MIIKYYNGYIPLSKIRELVLTNRNGTTAFNLIEGAKKLGFDGYGIKAKIDSDLILPVISHVRLNNFDHYIVIFKIDKKKKTIEVMDPALGYKKMSFNKFNNITTGYFLILFPIKKIPKEKKKSLLKYISKNIKVKHIFIITLLSLIEIIISILVFINMNSIINNFNNDTILIIIFLIMFKYIFITIKNIKTIKYNFFYQRIFLENIFSKLILLPYKNYRMYTTGEIITRIEDAKKIGELFAILSFSITNIIITVVSMTFLFFINHFIFYYAIFIIIIYIIETIFLSRKTKYNLDNSKMSDSSLISYMTEMVTGFESIKGLNLESHIQTKFKEKYQTYENDYKKEIKLKKYISLIKNITNDFFVVLLFIISVFLIGCNLLKKTDFFLCYILINFLLEPVSSILEIIEMLEEEKLSYDRLSFLEHKEKNKKMITGTIDIDKIKINLKDKIFLTGPSGVGKSTFLKALKQYYKSNLILVDGYPINRINLKDSITYISQDETLFTDTLYNNITMGKEISKYDLNKIIWICGLKELLDNNKLGLNMLIEENGFNLSGGEKQRIILARALVRNNEYLIIDEGLSETDIALERKILKRILNNYFDKTIIFVSHRTDNIDLFKKVIKWNKQIEIIGKEEAFC